ncbi:MAG: hypothetical protein Q7R99_02310 [bacterium]|nr:hypothetical protein [bacterium]
MTKTYKYVIGGVVGAVVLGVFLLSSGAVNPSWNPFSQPPSGEVLETAIYNLSKIEKMRILALVDLSIEKPKKITGALNLNQAIDYTNKDQKKNLTDFNLSVGIEGMELSINAEMVGIDKNLYLKINSLPPYLPLGVDVETLKNQWLLVDPAKLGLFGSVASTSDEAKTKQDTAFLNDLKSLIANKNLFKLKRNLGKGHYAAEVDKQTAKEVIPQIFAVISKQLPNSSDSYQQDLQKSLDEFEQNFDAIWKALGGLNFEVWIDENSQILKKVKFAKEIQQNKIGIEVSFTDFNKDIVIEAPLEFKPIEDVLPPDLLGLSTSTLTY